MSQTCWNCCHFFSAVCWSLIVFLMALLLLRVDIGGATVIAVMVWTAVVAGVITGHAHGLERQEEWKGMRNLIDLGTSVDLAERGVKYPLCVKCNKAYNTRRQTWSHEHDSDPNVNDLSECRGWAYEDTRFKLQEGKDWTWPSQK